MKLPNLMEDREKPLNEANQREEALDKSGAGGFFAFEEQITRLDTGLRELSNEARQLGSSVGILSAASRLRERLGRILYLFRENAADLFPHKVSRKELQVSVFRHINSKFERIAKEREKGGKSLKTKPKTLDSSQLYHFSDELLMFAKDIATLLECFIQFPEFVDEIPDQSLGEELKSWATSLTEFEDEFKTLAVQRYLHDSMEDIGERLDNITTKFIPVFIKIGIPTVRTSQEHSAANLTNMSTVATLFSGVTATMIQFSYEDNGTDLAGAVNVFWFTSLVFSISAAVNSLLGLTWMQAIFRSPDHRVPWWVRMWIKRSPLAFLVLSVAFFFIGLVLFMYSSNQDKVTTIFVTAMSSACSVALVAMSTWFACEWWVYNRFAGHKWLADVLSDTRNVIQDRFIIIWNQYKPRKLVRGLLDNQTTVDAEATNNEQTLAIGMRHRGFMATAQSPREKVSQVSFWLSFDKDAMTIPEIARHRWHEACRRIIDDYRANSNYVETPLTPWSPKRRGTNFSHISSVLPTLRATEIIPKLKSMTVVQELHTENMAHDALVRFMQFSPDGKSLVTSSWDRTSFILKRDEKDGKFMQEHALPYPPGPGFVNQLEWSPNGEMLLMRRNRCITAWKNDGRTLCNRNRSLADPAIRSVAWHPNNESFFAVEGNKVVVIGLTGEEGKHHAIADMVIRDIAVTKDAQWMFCVGKYQTSEKDQKHQRKKHHILLYHLVTNAIIRRAPVFHELCDVTLACDEGSILVSYEDKAPPQLLRLTGLKGFSPRMDLQHTYMPKVPTNFAGLPSIFGGPHDQLVLRAGAVGSIYIWDRDSASLLHRVSAPDSFGHLTSFTWNRAAHDLWMFATGSLEGAVQIWSAESSSSTTTVPRLSFPMPTGSSLGSPVYNSQPQSATSPYLVNRMSSPQNPFQTPELSSSYPWHRQSGGSHSDSLRVETYGMEGELGSDSRRSSGMDEETPLNNGRLTPRRMDSPMESTFLTSGGFQTGSRPQDSPSLLRAPSPGSPRAGGSSSILTPSGPHHTHALREQGDHPHVSFAPSLSPPTIQVDAITDGDNLIQAHSLPQAPYMRSVNTLIRMPSVSGSARGDATAVHPQPPMNAPDTSSASRTFDAYRLIQDHLNIYKHNNTYTLPISLRPTQLQRTVSHGGSIDSIAHPGLRDRMITLQARYDVKRCLGDYWNAITIHGDDILAHQNWEISESWLSRYGYLVDAETLSISNHWRRERGERELLEAECVVSESHTPVQQLLQL